MANIINPFEGEDKLQKILSREVPSQIPMRVVAHSYGRMLLHCMTQGVKTQNLWACRKNGARVNVRMVMRNVYDRETEQFLGAAPVGELYCSGCDKAPTTRKGDKIYKDELQTISV